MKKEKIIIANWKMQLTLAQTVDLAKKMKAKFATFKKGQVVVCPNLVSLKDVGSALKGSAVRLGAQNVFWSEKGAYTGEISPSMLKDAGCRYVIVGHSERRQYMKESYEDINKKVKAVLGVDGLAPIVCIGESWEERKTDRRDFILTEQLELALAGVQPMGGQKIVVAYEPIWAIGSGTAIEPSEAEYAHKIIKLTLNQMFGMQVISDHFNVVYGGSISSKNVKNFVNLENIEGLLVGGASLDADEFYKVANAITK
jgi:triosephosphate isomerase